MKFTDAFWYRYIAFDPMKLGKARIVKNTIFGMGVDSDTSRFLVWFANTDEKVYVEYEDIKNLDASSRPYRGKINGSEVNSGITAKSLLEVQSRVQSDILPSEDTGSRLFQRPSAQIKEKSVDTPDIRPLDVLREMYKDYPFAYGLPLRPYDSHLVVDEPHMYITADEWRMLGNDHDIQGLRHGVVLYRDRIGVDDAASFDMYPLTLNCLSATAFEEKVEEWLMIMTNAAELEIYDEFDAITSRTIRDYTEGWVRSQWMGIKHRLAAKHEDFVSSESDSPTKWEDQQSILRGIGIKDLETNLMMLADALVTDENYLREVENFLAKALQYDDPSMTEEHLNEWMTIIEHPRKRFKFMRHHKDFFKGDYSSPEADEGIKRQDRLEDACWELNIDNVRKILTDWVKEKSQERKAAAESKVEGVESLPNRPVISSWLTPNPIKINMVKEVMNLGQGTILRPCTDARIIELMDDILPLLGNRVPMRLEYLVWGIGNSTSMITYGSKAKQVLTVCPAQIERIYGRCDLDTLGSAITHEMGHYAMHQLLKNSDKMKFKKIAAGINLHNSQSTASGSTYPFYHEQFAMLCEYGVWGTCARGLQSTRGWEIVNKYFNIEQHITPDIIKKYQN